MSAKAEKKLRRGMRKFNKQVFLDFTVEVSSWPFFRRLWFCLLMACNAHKLQRDHRDVIKEHRAARKLDAKAAKAAKKAAKASAHKVTVKKTATPGPTTGGK